MAEAAVEEICSGQGDTLDTRRKLEACTSPLLDDINDLPDSLDEMLGRAPRKSRSHQSLRELSPAGPHTRLFEVIPADNRLLPCRSFSSWTETKISCLESQAIETMPPFEGKLTNSSETSLCSNHWANQNVSRTSSEEIILDSSTVDDLEKRERTKHSSGSMSWAMPLKIFSSKKSRCMGLDTRRLPKGIRAYYERQDDLIDAYMATHSESKINNLCEDKDDGMIATRLSQISFLVNLALMIAKALAVNMSNSLSIISSLVDSVVDLVSGIIIWWTSHAIRTTNLYVYPIGRSRLEPVAIIVLSVIMSLASLEVMISSVRKMLALGQNMEGIAVFELPTLLIAGSTVVIKFLLALSFYFIMKKKAMRSSTVDALIQDHRNDTMSNLVAILCGYLGSVQFAERVNTKQVAFIDPAGAIVIALYIIISWWQTGNAQLKMITGYTADPGFLSQITWVALNHSPKVLKIETVRAFYFGSKFLVEVDIILNKDTVLSESHDIGEKLQQKIESLPRVERAFVHVDYEWAHRPSDEHR